MKIRDAISLYLERGGCPLGLVDFLACAKRDGWKDEFCVMQIRSWVSAYIDRDWTNLRPVDIHDTTLTTLTELTESAVAEGVLPDFVSYVLRTVRAGFHGRDGDPVINLVDDHIYHVRKMHRGGYSPAIAWEFIHLVSMEARLELANEIERT